MNEREFKEKLSDLLNQRIEGFDMHDKYILAKKIISYHEKINEHWDTSNKGKPFSDQELELILSHAPSMENCVRFAKLFKRGYGSIEQIYRWSGVPNNQLSEEKQQNAFISQIRNVKKKLALKN